MTFRWRILLILAALPLLLPPALAAGRPTETQATKPESGATSAVPPGMAVITFRKIFKSSSPEYVEIKLAQNGSGTFDIRQLDQQPKPQPCQASPAITAKIFTLAADLHDFQDIHLDARRRIADLGEKTFRYDKNGQSYQASFNFTLNSGANHLLEIFEGLSLQDQYLDQLSSTMRYDPLGMNDVLLRLQSDLESHLLPDPEALVPILNQIASNRGLLDIARGRATQIVASLTRRR